MVLVRELSLAASSVASGNPLGLAAVVVGCLGALSARACNHQPNLRLAEVHTVHTFGTDLVTPVQEVFDLYHLDSCI